MSISPNVIIMTQTELLDYRDEWFNKGVKRGRFEERCDRSKESEGPSNWEETPTALEAGTNPVSRSCIGPLASGESQASLLPSDPAQKPVAWRYRWKLDGEWTTWCVSDHSQKVDGYLPSLEEVPLYTRPVSLDREVVKRELRSKLMDLPRITEMRSGVVRSYVVLDDVLKHLNGELESTALAPPANVEDEFRVIPGFEDYEITRSGSARRVKPLRSDITECSFLNSRPAPTGYRRFFLRVDRKPRSLFVHRAVALAWIGLPSADRPCVAHLDGDRTNNHVDNLAWVSYAENERHKSIHGTHPVGAARAASKMKDEDVITARRRFSTGEATIKDLADEYGIRMTTMSDLINGRTWTHLPVFPSPVQEPSP